MAQSAHKSASNAATTTRTHIRAAGKPNAQADFLKRAENRVNRTATEPLLVSMDPPGAANPADLLGIVKRSSKGSAP